MMQCSTRTSQEFIMSSITSDFSNAAPARAYASNVSVTARAFLAALFAVKPRASVKTASERPVSDRTRIKNLMKLHKMANQYDATMPGMASELRYLASRG
jgi:hypothetical protein